MFVTCPLPGEGTCREHACFRQKILLSQYKRHYKESHLRDELEAVELNIENPGETVVLNTMEKYNIALKYLTYPCPNVVCSGRFARRPLLRNHLYANVVCAASVERCDSCTPYTYKCNDCSRVLGDTVRCATLPADFYNLVGYVDPKP
jgi:hypothetical protein